MAIIKNGFLSGQIGNVVTRQVGDQSIVQTKPGRKVRQSESTKNAAEEFGNASAASAAIRLGLVETHQQLHDDRMHNRLIKHVQRVIRATPNPIPRYNPIHKGNIDRLVGFQFNENCHLQDYLYIDPTVTINDQQQVSVHFPRFHRYKHLRKPENCDMIIIQLETMAFQFKNKSVCRLGSIQEIEVQIQPNQKNETTIDEQTLLFDAPTHPYDSILVGMCLLYLQQSGARSYIQNSKDLHPAAIIGGFNRV